MTWSLWLLLLAALVFAALMSITRACLAAATRSRPAAAGRHHSPRVRALDSLLAQPDALLWALKLAGNAAKLAAAMAGTALIVAYQETRYLALAVILSLGLLALAPIIVEAIASRLSDRFCLLALPLLELVASLARPLYGSLRRLLAGAPGASPANGAAAMNASHTSPASVATIHPPSAEAARKDKAMLGGLLNLKELAVSDVMIHRTKMVMIDAALPPDEIIAAVLKSGHTRLPIFRDRPDNILGILNARDLLAALQHAKGDSAKLDIGRIAKPAWYVPDTRPISDQLNAFLKRKTHFALVVDEYGEVMGLITLEDILEEIVGDIIDEHDAMASRVRRHADGSFTIDGAAPIRDLNRALDWDLPDDEATTLAGLVVHEARMIPNPGQTFTFHNFRFEVLRKRRNQVTLLKVTPERRPAGIS
ncbi:MAG: CBS domain-containing protein [Rhizobiales bacterium]|nr:CBS domain-containing protein [Hyphomicrobiales bacterium]